MYIILHIIITFLFCVDCWVHENCSSRNKMQRNEMKWEERHRKRLFTGI